MAFVNELIPAEKKKQFEDRAVWDKKGRRWPFPATDSTRWNVDRERNMIARKVGGSGRNGCFYTWVLSVNGQQIQYHEMCRDYSLTNDELDLKFYIECIEMPSTLNVSLEQVKQWIEEVCYSEACKPSNTKYVNKEKIKVQVLFNQTPTELLYG